MLKTASLHEAMSLHQSGKLPEAKKAYQSWIASNPKDVQALIYYAGCLIQLNEKEEAIAIAKKGLAIQANSLELLSILSVTEWELGRTDDALASAKEATVVASDRIESWMNYGNMLYSAGQKESAIEAFEKLISLNDTIAAAHINLGVIYSELQSFGKAILSLKKALKLETDNAFAHKQLGMALHFTGAIEEAERHFHISLEKIENPQEKVEILILLGNTQRDQSHIQAAKEYYQKALDIDPNQRVAKDNLQMLSSYSISQWHFDMLADTARNDAYDAALKAMVKPEMQVLDIGAGSGLLSMMAVRAGAKSVCALEMVKELADITKSIVQENGFKDQIEVISKKSTSIEVGKELSDKADLVVSEILDCGLLGEGVLPSLRHAWKNLLKPDAVCIPEGADLRGQLIQSEEIHLVNPICEISGFDLSAFNTFAEAVPYQARTLNNLEYNALSDVFDITEINFYKLPPQASIDKPNEIEVEVEILNDGMIHGVAFWFNLHLNKDIKLSSGPGGELKHWGQAMYIMKNPILVKKGEIVNLVALQSETAVQFRID